MKTRLLILGFLLSTTVTMSQTEGQLVVFSNLGDKFYVIINGIQQNQQPESNVKIDKLPEGWYSCKIISETNLYVLTQNLGVKNDVLISYQLVQKKGQYKLRYYSESPLNSSPIDAPSNTVDYHSQPFPTTPPQTVVQTTSVSGPIGSSESTTTNSNQETITINSGISTTNTSTEINTSEIGANQSININIGISTTETTSTHSSSNGVTQNDNLGNSSCLVDDNGMKKMLSMINNESFSENKMDIAKQYTKNRCLTVNQIQQVVVLFSFSEDQMNYLKYAYDYCLNKNDYYELSSIFTFSEDKKNFSAFLDGK